MRRGVESRELHRRALTQHSRFDLTALTRSNVRGLPKEDFVALCSEVLGVYRADRKENQLYYYRPASERVFDVHRSTARLTGVGGGNGCLPLTAPVLMAHGGYEELGSIQVGDVVLAADPETGKVEPAPVTRVWRSGLKPVYRFGFAGGGSFWATLDHKVPLIVSPEREVRKHKLDDVMDAVREKRTKLITPTGPRRIRGAVFIGFRECGDIEVDHPAHCYITSDEAIVSNSSKTESCLVEMLIHCTGVVPFALRDIGIDWKKKLRGPIQARMVCENLTTVLQPIILPKMRWSHWTGLDEAGGDKGHWGWIPRACLRDGDWERSWSEKSRMLRLYYRNPDNFDEILGESTLQFMSYDQDPKDFESGDLHMVMLDEPPPLRIFRANEARTMRVAGRILMAMTWPDDPSINCDYIFDEIYEPARAGAPGINWVEISTLENRYLNQESIKAQSDKWDEKMRAVRIFGRPIRFSNRIHPLFSDTPEWYCFQCGEIVIEVEGRCFKCGIDDLAQFNHVEEFELEHSWPILWIVDPHPRKPHMSAYFAVTPEGDLWQVAELECPGSPSDMKILCDEMESNFRLNVRQRLMDPRMGSSPSSAKRREATWQQEFREAGLLCDLADPSDVGRELVNEYLKPDPETRRPRIRVHPRCSTTILQFKRFMWDNWKLSDDRDIKQVAKKKYDDYPAIYRYLLNARPDFNGLAHGYRTVRATGRGKWHGHKRGRPQTWPRTRLSYE